MGVAGVECVGMSVQPVSKQGVDDAAENCMRLHLLFCLVVAGERFDGLTHAATDSSVLSVGCDVC